MVELEPGYRRNDVLAGVKRGNHPGAKVFQKKLEKTFKREIDNGWMPPLPEKAANLLPRLMLSHINCRTNDGQETAHS